MGSRNEGGGSEGRGKLAITTLAGENHQY